MTEDLVRRRAQEGNLLSDDTRWGQSIYMHSDFETPDEGSPARNPALHSADPANHSLGIRRFDDADIPVGLGFVVAIPEWASNLIITVILRSERILIEPAEFNFVWYVAKRHQDGVVRHHRLIMGDRLIIRPEDRTNFVTFRHGPYACVDQVNALFIPGTAVSMTIVREADSVPHAAFLNSMHLRFL